MSYINIASATVVIKYATNAHSLQFRGRRHELGYNTVYTSLCPHGESMYSHYNITYYNIHTLVFNLLFRCVVSINLCCVLTYCGWIE